MKTVYYWMRNKMHKFRMVTEEDLDKKPEIPQSKFAKIHQRILDARKRKNEPRRI